MQPRRSTSSLRRSVSSLRPITHVSPPNSPACASLAAALASPPGVETAASATSSRAWRSSCHLHPRAQDRRFSGGTSRMWKRCSETRSSCRSTNSTHDTNTTIRQRCGSSSARARSVACPLELARRGAAARTGRDHDRGVRGTPRRRRDQHGAALHPRDGSAEGVLIGNDLLVTAGHMRANSSSECRSARATRPTMSSLPASTTAMAGARAAVRPPRDAVTPGKGASPEAPASPQSFPQPRAKRGNTRSLQAASRPSTSAGRETGVMLCLVALVLGERTATCTVCGTTRFVFAGVDDPLHRRAQAAGHRHARSLGHASRPSRHRQPLAEAGDQVAGLGLGHLRVGSRPGCVLAW